MSFSLFSELPAELRLQIWELALPGSRVVKIEHRVGEGQRDEEENRDDENSISEENTKNDEEDEEHIWEENVDLDCIVRSKIPALLHTCVQSRAVALQYYKPSFAKQLGNPVYFDYAQDLLWIIDVDAFRWFLFDYDRSKPNKDLKALRYLATKALWEVYSDRIGQDTYFRDSDTVCAAIKIFTGLLKVSLLPLEGDSDEMFWTVKWFYSCMVNKYNEGLQSEGGKPNPNWLSTRKSSLPIPEYTCTTVMERMMEEI